MPWDERLGSPACLVWRPSVIWRASLVNPVHKWSYRETAFNNTRTCTCIMTHTSSFIQEIHFLINIPSNPSLLLIHTLLNSSYCYLYFYLMHTLPNSSYCYKLMHTLSRVPKLCDSLAKWLFCSDTACMICTPWLNWCDMTSCNSRMASLHNRISVSLCSLGLLRILSTRGSRSSFSYNIRRRVVINTTTWNKLIN